jgi:hypothetical protein
VKFHGVSKKSTMHVKSDDSRKRTAMLQRSSHCGYEKYNIGIALRPTAERAEADVSLQ